MTRLAVRYPVSTVMVFVGLALLGAVSVTRMPTGLLPAAEQPRLLVRTELPGHGPEEVERLVTAPLEGRIASLDGVETLRSVSRAGESLILVEYTWESDAALVQIDLQKNLYEIAPSAAELPVVTPFEPDRSPVLLIGIAGPGSPLEQRARAERIVAPQLERLPGVARVEVLGGERREWRITLRPEALLLHDLAPAAVQARVELALRSLTAGMVRDGQETYRVVVPASRDSLDELRGIVVAEHAPAAAGADRAGATGEPESVAQQWLPVHLGEIADVREATAPAEIRLRVDGRPAVGLALYREGGATLTGLAAAVRAELPRIGASLPSAVTLEPLVDRSTFVRDAVRDLRLQALAGLLLAVAVIFFFLRSPSATWIVCCSIPVSLLLAFVPLYFLGVSLNLVSLGGLALAGGMLVDNSIVVLEAIVRRRDEGASPVDAAIEGTAEVRRPIVAATLTTVIVFVPVIYLRGLTAEFFKEQALAVSWSLLASLFVALALVPMLASRGAGRRTRPRARSPRRYLRLLDAALAHRRLVLGAAALAFAASALLAPGLRRELLPPAAGDQLLLAARLPRATPAAVAEERLAEIERRCVAPLPGLVRYHTEIGSRGAAAAFDGEDGGHVAGVRIDLGRGRAVAAAAATVLARCLGELPDLDFDILERVDPVSRMIGVEQAPVLVEVQGPETGRLAVLTAELAEALRGNDRLERVETDLDEGRPELRVRPRPVALARAGLAPGELADRLGAWLQRESLAETAAGGEDLPVVLAGRYDAVGAGRDELNVDRAGDLLIGLPGGRAAFLGELADLGFARRSDGIRHRNQRRVQRITARPRGPLTRQIEADVVRALHEAELPPGYRAELGGRHHDVREAFGRLGFALLLSLALIYMVLASLFESLGAPWIVLITLPLAAIGVVVPFALLDFGLNVVSGIGVILLAGIVVNNAVVLLDAMLRYRREGASRAAAARAACERRFRPVLMTALTTVLALAPLALGYGRGAELRAPLAVAVVGGLATATLLTLFVVPALFAALPEREP